MKISGSKIILTISGVVLALTTSVVLAKPRLQTGPDAEITHDGLHRVDKTVIVNVNETAPIPRKRRLC